MLEVCSSVVLIQKANQNSSCWGHDKSFYSFLLFVGVNISTKTLLQRGTLLLAPKPMNIVAFLTTKLIPMRSDVLEHSTTRHTVTIFTSKRFIGCSNFFMRLLAGGTSETNFDISSNLSKFVSLSLYYFALDFPKKTAHHISDVAFNHVIF